MNLPSGAPKEEGGWLIEGLLCGEAWLGDQRAIPAVHLL